MSLRVTDFLSLSQAPDCLFQEFEESVPECFLIRGGLWGMLLLSHNTSQAYNVHASVIACAVRVPQYLFL